MLVAKNNKMEPSMAAVLQAPTKLCSFSCVLLYFVLDVYTLIAYGRHTLLEIGSSVAHRKPDFEFLNAGALFTNTAVEPFVWATRPRRRKRSRKRGKRAGIFVKPRCSGFQPSLPTILLANVQSLDNKLCELRARIFYQRETRDCCVICYSAFRDAYKSLVEEQVEEQCNSNNARSMWQGINNITGFKWNKPATVYIAASLPDELNTSYALFEAHNTAHTESAPVAAAEEVSVLSISVKDVTRSLKRVNIHKAVDPCTFQLAGGFYRHFPPFTLSVCSSLLIKKSTSVPIPKKNKITCLNDWRPVSLTPIFSKCFDKLNRYYI